MEAIKYQDSNSSSGWGQQIATFFKKIIPSKPVSPAEISNQFQSFQAIGDTIATPENITDKEDCLKQISVEGQAFLKLGINDGVSGVNPKNIKNIALTATHLLQTHLESIFRKKLTAAQKKTAWVREKIDRTTAEITSLSEERKLQDEHYRLNKKEYNTVLAGVYIITSLILIVADLPLSYEIGREVFALTKNYQPWLFAAGVASITLYVKIIYDLYLGLSTPNFLLRKRPSIIFGETHEPASEQELKKARKIYNIQLFLNSLILIFIISTIVALGLVRQENDIAQAKAEGIMDEGSLFQTLAFIGVTVAFPLVSGICASIGFKHFNNISSISKTENKLKHLKIEKNSLSDEYAQAASDAEKYQVIVNWINQTDRFLAEQRAYFISCYQHGYQEGIHQATPKDFYEAAKFAQINFITQKTSELFTN